MDDVTIARAFHIVFVVAWIGGVGFVTTVLLPAVRSLNLPTARIELGDDRAAIAGSAVSNRGDCQASNALSVDSGIASGMAPIGGWTRWLAFG